VAWLGTLAQDVRLAAAMLRRRRGFTATVVLVVALGVGANTALFSVVDAVLLRPLPFPAADRLVHLATANRSEGRQAGVSYPDFADWTSHATTLEAAGLFLDRDVNLAGGGEPRRVAVGMVSPGLLDLQPGQHGVVLLSEHLWNRRYGGRHDVVGRTVRLDGQVVEIAGVVPEVAIFQYVDVWRPLSASAATSPRDQRLLLAFARLRSGATLDQAASELSGIGRTLALAYPATNRDWQPSVRLLHDQLADAPRVAILSLFGAGGFVLLIACANVASLLMARGAERRRELAIRRALGAGLGRLVRLLITETLLLALLGGGVSLLLSAWVIDGLAAVFGQLGPLWNPIEINLRVLGFTFLASLGAMALFGLAPAWLAARDSTPALLRTGGDGGPRGASLRTLFTAAQLALAAVLLAGAGFLLVSLHRSVVEDRGFDPTGVLTFQVSLPAATYSSSAQIVGFFDRLISRITSVPGVVSAGIASDMPIVSGPRLQPYTDGDAGPGAAAGRAAVRVASPGYFRVISLPLRAGRDFDPGDAVAGQPVAVVNEALARNLWPGVSALGRRVRLLEDEKVSRVVVGVVADVRQETGDEVRAECYVPFAQMPRRTMSVAVRVEPGGAAGFEDIGRAVAAVDPDLPMYQLVDIESMLAAGAAERGLAAGIVGVFGAVAIGLAAVGLGGLLFSLVTARTREIGVRLALGARAHDILRLVLGEFLAAGVAALVVGLAAAVGLAQLFRHALYGVGPADVAMFAGVAAVEIAVVLLVSLGPVRRAARVDPAVALRAD
jgi:putative ABC transport system permease protein